VEALLCWFSDEPFSPTGRYLLKHTTRLVKTRVSAVNYRVDIHTLEHSSNPGGIAISGNRAYVVLNAANTLGVIDLASARLIGQIQVGNAPNNIVIAGNHADVSNEGDKVSVYAEDSSTFGGTSRITLAFDPKTLVLKQWNVVDPQGYEVQVVLTGIDTRHEPDQMLFVIPSRSETRGKN
jgi:YVTN family beta-propeller protein